MFDNIIINEMEHKIFFDKEKKKLYVDYNYPNDPSDYIEKTKFIKIKNNLLFISKPGVYDDGNKVFRVDYYISFEYVDFELSDLSEIRFESDMISELFYNDNIEKETMKYEFKFEKSEFDINLVYSNNLKGSYYGHLSYESCLKVLIKRCDNYDELNKIINCALNLLSIIAVDINIKNCNISITSKKSKYIGHILFNKFKSKEKYISNYNFSIGNIWYLKDAIYKIVNTIYINPNMNLYFLSCYQHEYDNYDFFNIYSCFEYEYSKIDKDKLYLKEAVDAINQEKREILEILKDYEISLQLNNYINNYNPLEGHKKKLINGINYIKDLIYEELTEKELKDFIDTIYQLRINIVHNPNGNFIIKNSGIVMTFSQIVYILLLKRCDISDDTIRECVERFFIPVA